MLQEKGNTIQLYTDSDWVGCRRTRKILMLGEHCILIWAFTQGSVALSSAEAAYVSMVVGMLRSINLQSLGRELGVVDINSQTTFETYSSAATLFAASETQTWQKRFAAGRLGPCGFRARKDALGKR